MQDDPEVQDDLGVLDDPGCRIIHGTHPMRGQPPLKTEQRRERIVSGEFPGEFRSVKRCRVLGSAALWFPVSAAFLRLVPQRQGQVLPFKVYFPRLVLCWELLGRSAPHTLCIG